MIKNNVPRTLPHAVVEILFSIVKPILRYIVEIIDPLYISIYRRQHQLNRPIPPMRLRVRVGGSRWIDEFMDVGSKCTNLLEEALFTSYGKHISDYEKILDFGCGCGRIMQYLYWNDSPGRNRFYGCDVDDASIKWMQANYSKDNFVANLFEPPVLFGENLFDLVYAFSIFTHLDERMQFAWLKDIQRILRPGGIALLTIHGEKALQMFVDGNPYTSESMIRRLKAYNSSEENLFIYEPYEDLSLDKGKYPGISSTYGLTFHDHSYIYDHWGSLFEVRGICSNKDDNFQEVVVLKKM